MTRVGMVLLAALTSTVLAASEPAEHGLVIQVLSDGPKLRRDQAWPASSPVFDPAAREVSIRAGRNEFVGLQILMQRAGESLEQVTCDASDLRPESGAADPISRDNIDLYRAWYVQVTTPSYTGDIPGLGPGEYPDPLVPLSAPKYGMPFDLRKDRTELLWVDVFVPPGTAPGPYRGTLTIRAADRPVATLVLRLRVWHFTLPEETHFKSTFAYSPEFLRWGFRNPPEADLVQIDDSLHQVAHRHRANILGYLSARTPEQWRSWLERLRPLHRRHRLHPQPRQGHRRVWLAGQLRCDPGRRLLAGGVADGGHPPPGEGLARSVRRLGLRRAETRQVLAGPQARPADPRGLRRGPEALPARRGARPDLSGCRGHLGWRLDPEGPAGPRGAP